jgi:hypothetical protein
MFIAFLSEGLVIGAPVCFYNDSNASTEEVHMKIRSSRPMLKMCADAAADHRALLG